LVAGKAQNTLSDDNVARMAKAVLAFKSEDRFAKVVSIKELEENDYNLNLTRYVPLKSEDAALDVGAEVKKLMALYAERNEAEARLNAFLRELGYGI
jgi:type I restriction enzyme M protein